MLTDHSLPKAGRLLPLFFAILFCFFSFGTLSYAQEQTDDLLQEFTKSRTKIRHAIQQIGQNNDAQFLPLLIALKEKRLRVTPDRKVVIFQDEETAIHPLTKERVEISGMKLKTVRINNSVRRVLTPVLAQLQLFATDPAIRLEAAEDLIKKPNQAALKNLEKAFAQETESTIRETMAIALAMIQLNKGEKDQQLKAIATLREAGTAKARNVLSVILEKDDNGNFIQEDEELRNAAEDAIQSIDLSLTMIELVANFFRGLSLGSVLLLAALGLAITFGLMRVINMAHGEMIMIGAYATYSIQIWFQQYLPNYFGFYLMVAIPVSFLVAAGVGMIIERSVIRFLYGRPLETLLATWGLSLLLIQTIRLFYGAQNVEVANPDWLSGGVEIFSGFVLPYSRIAVMIFATMIVLLVWYLFQKTALGLRVRAVTQNREMASCMGISTAKTDMWTFGLGSGIAGLGGVALSQLGNVGPELGQGYIVDSFLVVVFGGVGKISGTVVSALGLGILNKYLEPVVGAVVGKILLLVIVILVIQKRPQGLFAPKGRIIEER